MPADSKEPEQDTPRQPLFGAAGLGIQSIVTVSRLVPCLPLNTSV
jgi:hypothetical protein